MYITNKTNKYPCAGYHPSPTGIDVRFSGVEGVTLPLTGSIMLVSEDSDLILAIQDCGDYTRQTYENGVLTLTNEPEPIAPTVEELLTAAKASALSRINGKCSAAIESGVSVDGVQYPLKKGTAQEALDAAVKQANSGETSIPYGPYGQPYTLYTAAQIYKINKAAYQKAIACMNYYALLPVWIQRETDMTVLNTIDFGSTLPSDLTKVLNKQLTAAGIDASVLAGMLTT